MRKLLLLIMICPLVTLGQSLSPVLSESTNLKAIGGSPIVFHSQNSELGSGDFNNQELGTESVKKEVEVYAYPNPVKDILTLSKSSNFEVMNHLGSVIIKGNSDKVDLSNLNSGVYYITLSRKTIKIVKL